MIGDISVLNDVKYPVIAKSVGSIFNETNGFIARFNIIGIKEALKYRDNCLP